MSRVIIDIETSGFDFKSLDQTVQDYLMRYVDSDAERQKVLDSLSFYPITGEIIAIGMLNPDTDKGVVYYQTSRSVDGDHGENTETMTPEPFEEDGITYNGGTEGEIIKRFWSVVKKYDQIITFNGRTFDAPFLMIRSAVHRIRPTRNLMPNRYSDEHIDLLDRLTFFGATRRFNLDTWCRTLGIKSPKTEDINGYLVPAMFKAGKSLEIARYCALDLRATRELFSLWQEYIKPKLSDSFEMEA